MKLETWVDINDGRGLQKVFERFDNNDWPIEDPGTVQSHCKTTGTPVITWGGPLCAFRSDNIQSYDIRNASIRSINIKTSAYNAYAGTTYDLTRSYKSHDIVPAGASYGLSGYVERWNMRSYNPDIEAALPDPGKRGCRRRIFQSSLGYIEIPTTC